MSELRLWKCDNGTYDVVDDEGVTHQNVPVQKLASAPEMFSALLECEAILQAHDYPIIQRQVKAALALAVKR